MAIERKLVGEPLKYKGHVVEARYLGPDLLCYVDGQDVGHFYMSVQAAHEKGCRYIDDIEKAKESKRRRNRQNNDQD